MKTHGNVCRKEHMLIFFATASSTQTCGHLKGNLLHKEQHSIFKSLIAYRPHWLILGNYQYNFIIKWQNL